jgi:hypothetical protein
MDGRAHFRKAEQFAEKAAEYLGHGDGQDAASVWAAVAQVHATLAVAAGLGPAPGPEPEPELEPTRSIDSGMISEEVREMRERDRAAGGLDQYPDADPLQS